MVFNLLRGIYDWTLSWAKTPYGVIALAVVAFMEASFFPIPPDILLIALCASYPRKSFHYVLICSAFSVLGGVFGYYIGVTMYDTVGRLIIRAFHYEGYFDLVGDLYKENAFLAILGAAFTPIPYKVFTIAAGVWKLDLWTLIAASAIGRTGRFLIVGALIYLYGAKIKELIDRYFNIFSILVFCLVAGGFILLKLLS